jgi:hypothetical protein
MDINQPINDYKKYKGICVICHTKINVNKEKYVKLTDYDGKKYVSECIYHLNCWLNRFSVTQDSMNKMANQWLDKISTMMGGTTTY